MRLVQSSTLASSNPKQEYLQQLLQTVKQALIPAPRKRDTYPVTKTYFAAITRIEESTVLQVHVGVAHAVREFNFRLVETNEIAEKGLKIVANAGKNANAGTMTFYSPSALITFLKVIDLPRKKRMVYQ